MTKKEKENPFLLMQETVQALAKENGEGKKSFAGNKLQITFNSPDFKATLDIRRGKSKTEKIMEIEGEMVKVDLDDNLIESHEVTHHFRQDKDGKFTVEVPASQVVKKQRLSDGTLVPASNLPMTNIVEIKEGRSRDDCLLDESNPAKALGTTIPREEVDKYAPETIYEFWDYAAGLLTLVEFLEKERIALYFPFSHGRGDKVLTAITFPLRIERNLYLVTRFCSGQLIYSHPVQKPAEAPEETRPVPVVVMPRFKSKQKSL